MDVFDKLKLAILTAAKEEQQRTDKELLPYFTEHMHTKSNLASASESKLKKTSKSKPYKGQLRNKKNTTNELYRLSRSLMDSLKSGGRGNLNEILPDGSFLFAIDLNIIPYARIHEYGGTAGRGVTLPARPYARPAIQDFMKSEMPRKVRNIINAALKNI